MSKEYNESSIQNLSTNEAMRIRPGMYIGNIQSGRIHLINEIVSNSIDEYLGGHCSTINIEINPIKNEIKVTDNGRGIPIGSLEDVCTKAHSGGKFKSGAYDYSGGLHGIGITVTNALSKHFLISSTRDKKTRTLVFSKGNKLSDKIEITNNANGTIVEWITDDEIFNNSNIDDNFIKEIDNMLYFKASINNGVIIKLNIINTFNKIYTYTDGIEGFYNRFIKDNKIKTIISDRIIINDKLNNMELLACIAFVANTDEMSSLQFVNGIENIDKESMHSQGVFQGIVNSLIKNMNNNGLIPKGIKVTQANIKEIISFIVLAKHFNPEFTGQTKEKFSSYDYFMYAKTISTKIMDLWCTKNIDAFNRLSRTVIQFVKLKMKAKDNKDIVASAANRSTLLSDENMSKFTDCTTKDRSRAELFIIEGVSAGGTMSKACDREYQATYKLRGKIKNVVNAPKINDELETLVSILGCGIGKKKDLKRLRFGKIIIACDADIDGLHIRSLAIGFFFTFYPELIQNGNIYIANPPLYAIQSKNEIVYINNEKEYEKILRKLIISYFEIINLKNNYILSNGLSILYLTKLSDYYNHITQISNQIVINPLLLESIIINFEDLINDKYKVFNNMGYTVNKKSHDNGFIIFEIDKNVEHYTLKIDKYFYNSIYLLIMNLLINIKLMNIGIRSKSTNQIISNSHYQNSKLLQTFLLDRKDIHVTRYKGLGEMDHLQLKESVTDPLTRYLTRVNLDNDKLAEKEINIYLGKNIEEKKKRMLYIN